MNTKDPHVRLTRDHISDVEKQYTETLRALCDEQAKTIERQADEIRWRREESAMLQEAHKREFAARDAAQHNVNTLASMADSFRNKIRQLRTQIEERKHAHACDFARATDAEDDLAAAMKQVRSLEVSAAYWKDLWNKCSAAYDTAKAQVERLTAALEVIQSNDPETNRQLADEIANRALADTDEGETPPEVLHQIDVPKATVEKEQWDRLTQEKDGALALWRNAETQVERLTKALDDLAYLSRNRTTTRIIIRDAIAAALADATPTTKPGDPGHFGPHDGGEGAEECIDTEAVIDRMAARVLTVVSPEGFTTEEWEQVREAVAQTYQPAPKPPSGWQTGIPDVPKGGKRTFWCRTKPHKDSPKEYTRALCYLNAHIMPLRDDQYDPPEGAVPVGDDGEYEWTGWHEEYCEQCDTIWGFTGEVVAFMPLPPAPKEIES